MSAAAPRTTIYTESLGGSPLSRAAREGQLPQWYRPAPRDASEWRAYAASVAASVPPTWADDMREAILPTGRAADRLARSANGKGIVITTGQQPGLFGGPLMTLIKAISARALADELQQLIGMPVAPLFWAATDDADFDEAAAVSVVMDGGARELRLEQRSPAGTPMARVSIDGDIDALADDLRAACGSTPHLSFLTAALDAFRDGATVGSAYVALLREILEPLEIAVLDVSQRSVSNAAAPLLRRAANGADAVASAVRARDEAIVSAGFTPQVDEVAALSLVFLNAGGAKRRLPMREAASLADVPENQFLSSTVLLRPVLERAILPTAAYVGGPGEIAYFAQVSAVAQALGVPEPLVVPRWSATIIDAGLQRCLNQLGLDRAEVADPHAADGRLARAAMPSAAVESLAALRANVAHDVDALRASSDGLIPSTVFEGLARSIEHRVARAERRLLAGVKRHESATMRLLSTVRGALYPHGVRQERKLSYIPLLAEHGPPLLASMLEEAKVHARSLLSRGAPALPRDAVSIAP